MGKRYERAGKELYSSKLGFLPRWAKVRGELGDLTMNKRVEKAEEAEWLRLQKGVAEKERLGEPLTDADRRIKSKTRDAYTNEAKGLENLSAKTTDR
jgi:hypothetical protein